MNNTSKLTRRDFVGTAASAAAFTIVPRHVLGGSSHVAPSESLSGKALVPSFDGISGGLAGVKMLNLASLGREMGALA